MTTKIFAIMLLSLALTACEPAATENNSNANSPAKANTNGQAPAPAATTPEASPSVKAELKAGDKVKVANQGSFAEGTVVSVDEKAGKVTVRLTGESKDKTVAVGDVTKQ
jgi:transcription antitermination factor NusG